MKFVVDFDSVTKQATVTNDGAPVADVECVILCRMWGPDGTPPLYRFEVESGKVDPANGIRTSHRVCAAADGSLAPVADPYAPAPELRAAAAALFGGPK